MWTDAAQTPSYDAVDRTIFERDIVPRHRPAVLRGYARDWAATRRATRSPGDLCDYLGRFAQPDPVQAWYGHAAMQGRFSYADDVVGRNFETRHVPLAQLLHDVLFSVANQGRPLFAGAVNLPAFLPGLAAELPMELIDTAGEHLASLWIGTRARTAAHWDLPQNLACVIGGRRRFTLFPIDQIGNLYIGPLENTLAGQPSSLVDFQAPDFERFPRFREAIAHAEIADLEPGDVLYLPSLWFHHVETLDAFGAMINFWWRAGPPGLPTPMFTLLHAFLTLRDLPPDERRSWRALFDHYVFGADGAEHVPPAARGLLGELTPELRRGIRQYVARSLAE
jgi:hypothetical protein